MSDLMSMAVTALRADQARVDQISLNAANITTPGYRRGVAVTTTFTQTLEQAQLSAGAIGQASRGPTLMPMLSSAVDPTPAAFNLTNRALDVAIDGKGYLTLADGDKTLLTRAGALRVDADGYLTGPRGLRVQGVQGDIYLPSQQGLMINAQGGLVVNGQEVAVLKLMNAGPDAHLTSADGVVLESSDGLYADVPAGAASVRSGFLETSNATGIQEMLQLVEGVRHFESITRLVQGYDDVMGRAIQKLGDL